MTHFGPTPTASLNQRCSSRRCIPARARSASTVVMLRSFVAASTSSRNNPTSGAGGGNTAPKNAVAMATRASSSRAASMAFPYRSARARPTTSPSGTTRSVHVDAGAPSHPRAPRSKRPRATPLSVATPCSTTT